MDTLASELPAVLGYLALAVILAVGVVITILAQRARRNYVRRHARRGCGICRLRLTLEEQQAADADVDAWLDYPTAGGAR